MGNQIKGWKPASKYCNGVPVRTLRKAVDEGILPAHKDNDGVWTFDVADLDAWCAQHVTATAAPAPVAAAIAYPGEPDHEPARHQAPVAALWLHRAADPQVDNAPPLERPEPAPARDPLGSSGEQPFWLTQGLRAEVDTRAQLEAAHAEVTQLTQQLAQVTQQLRTARIAAVAQATAIESLAGAVAAGLIPDQVPQITHALRDSAAAALSQLDPARLLRDDFAFAIARQAAHVASMQIARQIDRDGRKRRDRDDEMHAERERAARDEQDREREMTARRGAMHERFRAQQLAMSRRQSEELTVMREAIGAVAEKRERNVDVDREREREERDRARQDHERAAQAAYQQRVQELQQQQADQVAALRADIAALAAKRRGRN